jgi:hypothetical protein
MLCLSMPRKHEGGEEARLHSLLTSAEDKGSQIHAPAALALVKEPRYPLDRSLGGPQSRSGRFVKKKNLLPLPGFEPRIE